MLSSKLIRLGSLFVGLSILALGCAGRPSIIPNTDPALRKTSAWFAADAVKRFPFPSTQPFAGAWNGRADVDVMRDVVQIANFADEQLTDVDVWINRAYVVHVPKIEANKDGKPGTRTLDFQMFFNEKGESFPTDNDKYPVNNVDILSGGSLYSIRIVVN